MAIAKSIDPGQPAQSDHDQNFSLLADFPFVSDNSTKSYCPVATSFPFLLFFLGVPLMSLFM